MYLEPAWVFFTPHQGASSLVHGKTCEKRGVFCYYLKSPSSKRDEIVKTKCKPRFHQHSSLPVSIINLSLGIDLTASKLSSVFRELGIILKNTAFNMIASEICKNVWVQHRMTF